MDPNLNLFASPKDKLIIALDNVENIEEVRNLLKKVSPHVGWAKIGFETILGFGLQPMIEVVKDAGLKIFVDVKINDIPNTMVQAALKLLKYDVEMFNIHCSAGPKALAEIAKSKGNTIVLGVTVLTSFDDEECQKVFNDNVSNKVLSFTQDAQRSGINGIVCSAQDLQVINNYRGLKELLKITPGIQPSEGLGNDQTRVTTAKMAIRLGATAIVVGRAITQSADPAGAAKKMIAEIEQAIQLLK